MMDILIVQIYVHRQQKLLSCLRTTSAAQLWQHLDLIMPLVTRNMPTMPCQLVTCPNSQKGGLGKMGGAKCGRAHFQLGPPTTFIIQRITQICQGGSKV